MNSRLLDMEKLKGVMSSLGSFAISIGIGVALLLIFLILIKGGGHVADFLMPYLNIAATVMFVIDILLLPFTIFRKTRGWAGLGFYISSYIFGIDLWVLSFLLCLAIWGPISVIIGLLLGGIGVLPIAMLATALHGEWALFFSLIFDLILAWGSRALGAYLVELSDS